MRNPAQQTIIPVKVLQTRIHCGYAHALFTNLLKSDAPYFVYTLYLHKYNQQL